MPLLTRIGMILLAGFSLCGWAQFGGIQQPMLAVPSEGAYFWYVSTNGFDTTTHGASVTNWLDNSGNGNTLLRNAAYADYGTYATGTIPALRLEPNEGNYTNGFRMLQPCTLFYAFKMRDQWPQRYNVLSQILNASAPGAYLEYDDTNPAALTLYGGTSSISGPLVMRVDSVWVLTAYLNGTNSYLRTNGSAFASGNPGTAGITNFSIGGAGISGSSSWLDVYEIRGYARTLSDADRNAIETEWVQKYVPAFVEPNLVAWYVSTNGFDTTTPGANITSWADTSGNGRSLQRDAAFGGYSTYAAGPPASIHHVGGSGHYTNAYTLARPYTMFVAFKMGNQGANQYNVITQLREGEVNGYFRYDKNLTKIGMEETNFITGVASMVTNSTWVLTGVFDRMHSYLRTNGVACAEGSIGEGGMQNFSIGGAGGYGGSSWTDTYEVLIYNGIPSTTNMVAIENELKTKYGL